MMRLFFLLFMGVFASVVMFSTSQTQARETFPACDNERVLKKIVKRFNQTEKIYWKDRSLTLAEISHPHLHNDSYLPESPIARRYCHATAHFENSRTRKVHYLIEDGLGFAGFGWNVEYCIHGLDPWKYYDGRCRVLSK